MSRKSLSSLLLPAFLIALLAGVAQAHPGHGAHGLVTGFAHPLTGLDHILAMIAVGLWAAQLGGKARWLVPLSFISFMLVGGIAGFNHPIPFTDTAIATTVLILGLLIATATRLPLAAGMLLTAVFALCHGYAHGAELPASASTATFAIGFILATALLHAAGLFLGLFANKLSRPALIRIAGVGIAAAALAFYLGILPQ